MNNKQKTRKEWLEKQTVLSAESGLAISLVDQDGLKPLVETNDNSICTVLKSSDEFAPQCEKYCGSVFSRTLKAKQALKYQCHAGLECVAVPILKDGKQRATMIAGRAFTKAGGYKTATEKAISGEWSKFAPSAVFENVLLTGSQSVEILAKQLASLNDDEIDLIAGFVAKSKIAPDQTELPKKSSLGQKLTEKKEPATAHRINVIDQTTDESSTLRPKIKLPRVKDITQRGDRNTDQKAKAATEKTVDKPDELIKGTPETQTVSTGNADRTERDLWRSVFGSMLDHSYSETCKLVLSFIRDHYKINSLAWLESRNNQLATMFAVGNLKKQKIQISVAMNDPRMQKLLQKERSIELRERKAEESPESIRLFPLKVGEEIRSAIVIGDRIDDDSLILSIADFCHFLASDLEILRLREELSRRSWLDIALKKFNESLTKIDDDDFWIRLMQTTAELVQAERGSLLIFDEKEGKLNVKAAIGRKADVLRTNIDDIGQRIALGVWERGETLLVRNLVKDGIEPAPAEWSYRTNSFISYPLVIGDRIIGVLNIADKTDGTSYEEEDVRLLDSVVPQISVAADRANLKSIAGEYEQLSVTDPLTGLLNRRYLEERLAEEIIRSSRHGYPMSFMMIDVDDFKSYNDQFLHPEGDKALKIVGQCLRETLRGADVAARYGGEEFSILLPQTTLREARTIAERIRRNIETADFPHRQVTVSIGIATISADIDSPERLIECADTALFEAKREGKNQVNVFHETIAEHQVSVH